MKLIKLGIVAAAATLLLGTFSAKASPFIGTVTNFSKLNLSLVVTTNSYVTNGTAVTITARSIKFVNKDFLNLFTNWAGTTWPSGTQLVQGWDEEWDGDVLVVDKSGTNVLFDANVSDNQHFTINIFAGEGAFNEKKSLSLPSAISYTWFNNGYFELVDQYYLPVTDIHGYGPCTEKFSGNLNSGDYATKWSDSEKFTVDNAGYADENEMEFLGNIINYGYVTIHAELDSSGQGSSDPWYLY